VTEQDLGRHDDPGVPRRPIGGVPRALSVLAVLVAVAVAVSLGALVLRRADDRLSGGRGGPAPAGQVGVPWDRALLSTDGGRVAVRFEGSPLGGDQPCGAYYVGLSTALNDALRVTVITLPGPEPTDGGPCPDGRAVRCVEVQLPYPPGDRPVVDAMTGAAPALEQAPTSLGGASQEDGAGGGNGSGETTADGSGGEAPGDLCAQLTGS
jgi:hypothetical protein